MATTDKNVNSAPSTTSPTTVYTVPGSTTTTVKEASLVATATTHVLLIFHDASGSVDRTLIDAVVDPGESVDLSALVGLVMEAGDVLKVSTSVASSINLDVSIEESDASVISDAIEQHVAALGAAVDGADAVGTVKDAGSVSGVSYAADGAVSGANTDTRTLSLVNKGPAGAGSTVVASLALAAGTNLTADDPKAITLSVTPADLVVAAGDVLEWTSTHAGTGLADPGGLVHVAIARS